VRLGAVALDDDGAVGAVLVHTLHAGDRVLKKGRVLDAADVAALRAAGLREVTCARLEPGDVGEDAAAAQIAAALATPAVRVEDARTGRANLFAAIDGLLDVDPGAVARVNAIDEAITLATLAPHTAVRAGDMIATVKIIPFAAPAPAVAAARDAAHDAIALHPWRARRAGLVLTRLPDTPPRALDRATEAQRARLARCGGALVRDIRVDHDVAAVARAIAALAADGLDPILALGASAIMDRRDVIPAALERAGGTIVRLGMPVDPGNLLLLGQLGAATVIGVPGCARSEKRSGFDWVLERVCAGETVGPEDLAAMGVGGLLEEIAARPSPRRGAASTTAGIAAIVLAAGRATRMGSNKLCAELDGEPIIRRVVRAAVSSSARPVIVVVGDQADRVTAALAGLDVQLVRNPDFAQGMSTSLRAGIAAAGAARGALIVLGDMPMITAAHLDALITAVGDAGDDAILVPTCERKRGNPVLWPQHDFAEIAALTGDVGARALLERHADRVRLVPLDDPAILTDVDTPEALAALRGKEG